MSKPELLEKLAKVVIDGDEEAAKKVAEEAIATKINPLIAIKEGLAKGMNVVGKKFHDFEIFLPEILLAAEAMKVAIGVIKPHLTSEEMKRALAGKVVIGTVFGDIHDIGKSLVATMLEVAGFEVTDLGRDVPPKQFIEKAKEINADIIAMSCLLSPSMLYQKDVIDYLKDVGDRDKYWIMVGGAAVTPDWTAEIGADGWGRHAEDGVEVGKILVEKGKDVNRPVIKGA